MLQQCEYGCGQVATYYKLKSAKLPNGRYSCAVSPNSCPVKRQKMKGENNPSKRPEVREKISAINSVLFAAGSENRKKCQQTLDDRYGVNNPMRVKLFADKVVAQRRIDDSYSIDQAACWTASAKQQRKQTRIDRGYDVDPNMLSDFRRYEKLVDYLTEKAYTQHVTTINPSNHKRGRVKGTHQLDHIISKKDGFTRGLLPMYISHPANLRIMTIEENISKGANSHMTVNELFDLIDKFSQL
jgi:hypothetical protein|tara:strand:- start:129 stop:854 length:726 start_codon:yes stop_codon:yes gene_type:complete